MKTLRKYLVSAFVAIVLSLTLANVTAMACVPVDEQPEYTCEYSHQDDCFCYYNCTCHVDIDACHLALFRNGYMLIPPLETE